METRERLDPLRRLHSHPDPVQLRRRRERLRNWAIACAAVLLLITGGCGSDVMSTSLAITPGTVTIEAGNTQQFSVSGATGQTITWKLSGGAAQQGSISASGLYTAPLGIAQVQQVTVAALSSSASGESRTSTAVITVQPCVPQVMPAAATVQAGAKQNFSATSCLGDNRAMQWSVNGVSGGSIAMGAISANGVYTAPAIDPGTVVSITVEDPTTGLTSEAAAVTVNNPPPATLEGATYAATLAGWNAYVLPWMEALSGLTWNSQTRIWTATPGWTVPSEGIAPNVYYLEEGLRPLTRMAIAHQDLSLLDELAAFHIALLAQRTTTIGAMLADAPANAVIFIDGPPQARTFAWYEPLSVTQVRIRDCQSCNAQYLSTAARLLRAISELPPASRTETMMNFAQQYTGFLVSDQLLRLMYGTTVWSHWDNPNIPQPVVAGWAFLARTGYRPPHPYYYQAAMTDMELWMVSDSAEVLGADAEAPELNLLDSNSKSLLNQAVAAGTSLMAARCHHGTAPDGADVLSLFAGDYDDHPDYAYSAITTPEQPGTPSQKLGLGWDISHSYRFPVIFRSLYENRGATGQTFPALNDLVALGNSYVHLAFNGNQAQPAFSNYIDGWNGWYAVEELDIPNGYPPHNYCQSLRNPDNCLTAGTVQGWGLLSEVNPTLGALTQKMIDLAYDDSVDAAAFKDQHYYYAGQYYNLETGIYPQLMVYLAADSAERLE